MPTLEKQDSLDRRIAGEDLSIIEDCKLNMTQCIMLLEGHTAEWMHHQKQSLEIGVSNLF